MGSRSPFPAYHGFINCKNGSRAPIFIPKIHTRSSKRFYITPNWVASLRPNFLPLFVVCWQGKDGHHSLEDITTHELGEVIINAVPLTYTPVLVSIGQTQHRHLEDHPKPLHKKTLVHVDIRGAHILGNYQI